MDYDGIVAQLFMAVALIGAIGVCLPDVLFLLGLTGIQRGVLDGAERVRSDSSGILTEDIAHQLDALGFVPAGVYWEQLPADRCFHEVIFVSPAGDCFAAVYRLFNNDPSRVAFKTSFLDDAYVLTQNYAGGMKAIEETLWAGGLPYGETNRFAERAPLEAVLEEHRKRVRYLTRAGHEPLPALTMDDHVEAEWSYMDHPTVRWEFRKAVASNLVAKLTYLVGGPWALSEFGLGHSTTVSVLLFAQSLSVLLFRYYGATILRLFWMFSTRAASCER